MKDRNKECPECMKVHRTYNTAKKCHITIRNLNGYVCLGESYGPREAEIKWRYDKMVKYLQYMGWEI